MKLFITDNADPSVGMFPCTWQIEVPFLVDDAAKKKYRKGDDSELGLFHFAVFQLYRDYCDGRCEAYYEFENTNDI